MNESAKMDIQCTLQYLNSKFMFAFLSVPRYLKKLKLSHPNDNPKSGHFQLGHRVHHAAAVRRNSSESTYGIYVGSATTNNMVDCKVKRLPNSGW